MLQKLKDKIIELHQSGLKYSAIAKSIHVTRNTVAGVLYRFRVSNGYIPEKCERKIDFIEINNHVDIPIVKKQPKSPCSLLEIEFNQCHYIASNPSSMLCCGKPVVSGSYCEEHANICYERKKRQPTARESLSGSGHGYVPQSARHL